MSALAAGLLGFVGGTAGSYAARAKREEESMREMNIARLKADYAAGLRREEVASEREYQAGREEVQHGRALELEGARQEYALSREKEQTQQAEVRARETESRQAASEKVRLVREIDKEIREIKRKQADSMLSKEDAAVYDHQLGDLRRQKRSLMGVEGAEDPTVAAEIERLHQLAVAKSKGVPAPTQDGAANAGPVPQRQGAAADGEGVPAPEKVTTDAQAMALAKTIAEDPNAWAAGQATRATIEIIAKNTGEVLELPRELWDKYLQHVGIPFERKAAAFSRGLLNASQ